MLPLPDLAFHAPTSVAEAVGLLATHGGRALLVAGGTDLLPNLKHGIAEADALVWLGRIPDLAQIHEEPDGGLRIGALTPLARLAADPRVESRAPALARAASLVASPQIRNMGTLGGNLCLDTRCVYVNQTEFWRDALGNCIKKPPAGETLGPASAIACHVVPNGRRCVAAASADTPPVLIALGASVRVVGPGGERTLPVEDLYSGDGAAPVSLQPGEILLDVLVPPPSLALRSTYQKMRLRQAIDFPLIGLAIALRRDEAGLVTDLRLVATGLGAKPRQVPSVARVAMGQPLSDATIEAVAEEAHHRLHPLANMRVDPTWRREMVRVLVRRGLRELV